MSTTTIRVKTETRDRLHDLGVDHLPGASLDEVIIYLLDERWKATCIAQADQRRDTDRAAVRLEMASVAEGDDLADELDEDPA